MTAQPEPAPATNRRSRRTRGALAMVAVLGVGAGLTLAAWTVDSPFGGDLTKSRSVDDIVSTLEARAVWLNGGTIEADAGWSPFVVDNGSGEIVIDQRDFTVGDQEDSLIVQVRSTAAELPAEWVTFTDGLYSSDYFEATAPNGFENTDEGWATAVVEVAAADFAADDLLTLEREGRLAFYVNVEPTV